MASETIFAGAVFGHAHDVLGGDDALGLRVRVGNGGFGVSARLGDQGGSLGVGTCVRALSLFFGVRADLGGTLIGLVEGGGCARVRLGDTGFCRGVRASQDRVGIGDDGVGSNEILRQSSRA